MRSTGRLPSAAGQFTPRAGTVWPWALAAATLGYLSLLPGTVLLDQFLGVQNPGLTYGLTAFSFTFLPLALVAARAQDRKRSDPRLVRN
jgi:hypothetical protein